MVRNLFLTIALAGLSACGGGGLRDLRGDLSGPDEFSIIPSKPLVIPENLNLLPPPTPGGTNPADPNPKGDAIAALGGNPAMTYTLDVDGTGIVDIDSDGVIDQSIIFQNLAAVPVADLFFG